MNSNKYFKLWFPIMGVHALHQLEESISFFQWYVAEASKIPDILRIQSVESANSLINHPEYFILISLAQIGLLLLIAFGFKKNEKLTKYLLALYLFGFGIFMIWHVLISYYAHSYAPIMITSIGGLYFIFAWSKKLFNLW